VSSGCGVLTACVSGRCCDRSKCGGKVRCPLSYPALDWWTGRVSGYQQLVGSMRPHVDEWKASGEHRALVWLWNCVPEGGNTEKGFEVFHCSVHCSVGECTKMSWSPQ